MNRFYMITFEQHIHCEVRNFVYICEASGTEEAKAKAKQEWYFNHKSHMFHTKVKWLKGDILPTITNWKGFVFTPPIVCNKMIMIDTKTWRVDGRNLYGV